MAWGDRRDQGTCIFPEPLGRGIRNPVPHDSCCLPTRVTSLGPMCLSLPLIRAFERNETSLLRKKGVSPRLKDFWQGSNIQLMCVYVILIV